MNTIDHAIAWRDEQIEMLRETIREKDLALRDALDRAGRAEDALRILREEVAECQPTP